jgi:signal transduction histidine kinase
MDPSLLADSDRNYPGIQNSRILIVDDEEQNLVLLSKIIRHAGYAITITLSDPKQVLERFRQLDPDLLVLDWHMAPVNGHDLLNELQTLALPERMPPVLVVTADSGADVRRKALAAGATDFLAKPLDHIEVILRIRNLLRLRFLNLRLHDQKAVLADEVQLRTAELQERTAELEKAMTELRDTQTHIVQQERIRALGAMAGGVAHDFNNALAIITGFSDICLRDDLVRRDPDRVIRNLQNIRTAGEDAAETVKRLSAFYRPASAQDEDRSAVDVNSLIDSAIALTEPKWRVQTQTKGIDITIERQFGRLPEIGASAAELREALTNLIFNAVDAMPQGGRILFRTSCDSEHVKIEVEDTGTGMTVETKRRCLDPFYTTKGDAGSGLGLSMIYGIVQRHNGELEIETQLNKGTKFTLNLPIIEPVKPPDPKTERRQSLRVLVVDDQPDICEVLSGYLEQDQHTVVTAQNGCEAIEKFLGSEFDVVITDRAMPKMSGDQLASAIKGVRPSEPVIMLTAFAPSGGDPKNCSPDVDYVLMKPASLPALRQAMATVVAA